MSFRDRLARPWIAGLTLLLAASIPGPASAAVPTPTAIEPASGVRFDDGSDFPRFTVTTQDPDPAAEYLVRISQEPTTGPDGLLAGGRTLAFTRDPASAPGSDVFVTQDAVPERGTFHWQVQARDPDPPNAYVALSPISTYKVLQTLEMTLLDAEYETERAVRTAARPPAKGYVLNHCVRRSVSSFDCRAGWSTRRHRLAVGSWIRVRYLRRGNGSVMKAKAYEGRTYQRKCVLDVVRTGRVFGLDDCSSTPFHLRVTLGRLPD